MNTVSHRLDFNALRSYSKSRYAGHQFHVLAGLS